MRGESSASGANSPHDVNGGSPRAAAGREARDVGAGTEAGGGVHRDVLLVSDGDAAQAPREDPAAGDVEEIEPRVAANAELDAQLERSGGWIGPRADAEA